MLKHNAPLPLDLKRKKKQKIHNFNAFAKRTHVMIYYKNSLKVRQIFDAFERVYLVPIKIFLRVMYMVA